MLKNYELCFLIKADLPEENFDKEIDFIERVILREGAEIVKKENLGRKTLAYPIKKKEEAVYYIFYIKSTPDKISKIESEFYRRENILRYLFLRRKKFNFKEEVDAGTVSQ
ncbi:MAG: 30S ribosomal protein S6 [Candidatus Omnitrophica bacterium]|nr:30S ribosomal protein S6 [Candidatus Omnitrophota bacterium]MCM8810930.1 30S ribosomal protein S6 [Candidatus Omnitrophota bacterium]MCM8833195.1 30S ribosomal protein S6 [Candidatus Omnitrophota bacterium]